MAELKNRKQTVKEEKQNGRFVLILVAMLLGMVIGIMFNTTSRRFHRATTLQDKMAEVMSLVEGEYVDAMSEDTLSERLLAAMLSELDPHSSYMPYRELQRMNEQMRGGFSGVGLILHREGDTSWVSNVMEFGPSYGHGILPGDMIFSVDGDTLCGPKVSADSVVSRLRGVPGTTVHIGLKRGKEQEPIEVSVKRGLVITPSLAYSTMLDPTTGYILLQSFTSTSYNEFHDAITSLKRQGMKRLVLDLRGNGGGSLASAIGIAGEFLPKGSLIVYTQGAHSARHNTYAEEDGIMTEGEVVVLIDEFSASASEVVTGALQDNDRATVMGRRSFGKGLVQTEFELSDGSGMLLTTARYFTPSGRCIQRPYDEGSDEYYRQFLERVVRESQDDSLVTTLTDTTPYYTTGGRTVYGGGGIYPDVVLPYQHEEGIGYYNQMINQGIVNRAAFAEVRQHAAALLEKYFSLDYFRCEYHTPQAEVDQMVAQAVQRGLAPNEQALAPMRDRIATMFKAYVAMSLYGNEAFHAIYLEIDSDLAQVRAKL